MTQFINIPPIASRIIEAALFQCTYFTRRFGNGTRPRSIKPGGNSYRSTATSVMFMHFERFMPADICGNACVSTKAYVRKVWVKTHAHVHTHAHAHAHAREQMQLAAWHANHRISVSLWKRTICVAKTLKLVRTQNTYLRTYLLTEDLRLSIKHLILIDHLQRLEAGHTTHVHTRTYACAQYGVANTLKLMHIPAPKWLHRRSPTFH